MDDISHFLQERNAALSRLDMAYARRMLPGTDDETLLVALHKARCECEAIDQPLREESRKWLTERGFTPGIGTCDEQPQQS